MCQGGKCCETWTRARVERLVAQGRAEAMLELSAVLALTDALRSVALRLLDHEYASGLDRFWRDR